MTPRLQTSEEGKMRQPVSIFCSRVWGHNQELFFITVKLEQVGWHPYFDFIQAVDKWLWGEQGGGFGTELKLFIISTRMEARTMATDDLTKGEHYDGDRGEHHG